ncbi:MAG: hypothetical protein HYU78_00720 [Rhodocyclales bacterium]|nr:hypothetical protein [Rhodocyclales bacterium]
MPQTIPPSARDYVTFVATITNIVLTLLIAFFGYLISSDVRDIQEHADQRAKAREVQEFWGEMRLASQKLDEQSRHFGESLAKFTIASAQLMDEYDRIYRSGRLGSLNSDLKYLAAYATYIGAYGELSASVASVGNEYALLRVRYAATAATHGVAGWTQFASQDKDVSDWITEIQSQLDKIARSVSSVVTERKDPTPMEEAFSTAFARLGSFLATKPIPYARGLAQFLDANWKYQPAVITGQ